MALRHEVDKYTFLAALKSLFHADDMSVIAAKRRFHRWTFCRFGRFEVKVLQLQFMGVSHSRCSKDRRPHPTASDVMRRTVFAVERAFVTRRRRLSHADGLQHYASLRPGKRPS